MLETKIFISLAMFRNSIKWTSVYYVKTILLQLIGPGSVFLGLLRICLHDYQGLEMVPGSSHVPRQ